jgi:chromate transporter
MVVQFVGFLGAYRDAGGLAPLASATLAAVLTTWVTFMPCFLWIFLGAPHVERLRGNRALSAALSTITAAVVGVVLNLAVWFSLHLLFRRLTPLQSMGLDLEIPVLSTVDWPALLLTFGAIIAVFRFNLGLLTELCACAVIGVGLRLAGVVS